MGEIADAMLDGTLCEGCGAYLGDDTGFPGYCSDQCAKDRGALSAEAWKGEDRHQPRIPAYRAPPKHKRPDRPPNKKFVSGEKLVVNGWVPCPFCLKRVGNVGLADHMRTLHEAEWLKLSEALADVQE